MWKKYFFVFGCLMFFTATGVRKAFPDDILYERGDLPKMVNVVKTSTPPVIDGIMSEGEWDNAVSITGLTRVRHIGQSGINRMGREEGESNIINMADEQSHFWITYDEDFLYVAHRSLPPAQIAGNPALIPVMLKRNQTIHDANINWDDSIHIAIIDPEYPGGDKYVIQVNSIGTTFEMIWGHDMPGYSWEEELAKSGKGRIAGGVLSWDPLIINESTLTLEEGWTIELAIPWEELAPHIAKPEPGDVMYMNFGRIWREIIDEDHAWKAHDAVSPAGELIFAGEEGIVVQLKDTGNMRRGDASFIADIRNLYATERSLSVEIDTDSGELYDMQAFTLMPGDSKKYSFKGRIVDFATTKIEFRVIDNDAEKTVHLTALPVMRPTEPEIFTRRYLTRKVSKFEVDMSFIGSADPERAAITLTLSNKESGRRVLRKRYRGFSSYQPVLDFSTAGLDPGIYEAHFVFGAPGMARYETVVDYEHPALPEWWDNRYGLEETGLDIVPYPWIPLSVKEDTVYVWGREYRFGTNFFPEQITTLDYPIMSAPMRMLIETSGGEVLDTSSEEIKSEWTESRRTRAEGLRSFEAEGFMLENKFWLEYDGFLWSSVTLLPKGEAGVERILLEIPLTKEFTDVINTSCYQIRGTGKLSPEGLKLSPERPVWLGNADGGIQWMSSEFNSFFVKDPLGMVRAEVDDGRAVLKITILDMPTLIDAPYKIEFGIMATPVRPKTWRTPEMQKSSVTGGGAWYPPGMSFMPAADPGYDYYGIPSTRGRIYVHTDPVNLSPEALEKDATGSNEYLFVDEWRANASDRSLELVQTNFSSQSFRNYFVWRHWNYQQKYGYEGLYYDCPYGYGSTSPDLLGTRDIMKRLYNVTLSNRHYAAREQAIGVHQSGMPHMAFMGYATYNWNAENLNSVINQHRPVYRDVVDPAVFRAEYMGHNFGWPIFFLGQGRIRREWVEKGGGAEAVFDHISGLAMLHDGWIQGGVCCILPRIEGVKPQEMRMGARKRRDDAIEKHNLLHWKYQFLPYWKQDIVSLPEGMLASLYLAHPSKLVSNRPDIESYFTMFKHMPSFIQRRIRDDVRESRRYLQLLKDKAVLIVYNDTDWEGETRLQIDWEKLGLGAPETLVVENAVHSTGFTLEKRVDENGQEYEEAVFFARPEEYAKIENGELVFPTTPHNYRMIVIEKNQQK